MLLAFLLTTSGQALAACQNPHGEAGHLTYNSDARVLQWCDGTQWIGLPKSEAQMSQTVAAGNSHSCAIDPAGQAWCWGNGAAGRLGDGLSTNSAVPVQVSGEHVFTTIAAALNTTCALDTEGKAWCWGAGGSGQLGNGEAAASNVPVAVDGGRSYSSISVGLDHACAIDTAGQGWCWGAGGAPAGTLTPVAIDLGADLIELKAGGNMTCAISGASRHLRCASNAGEVAMEQGQTRSYNPLSVGSDSSRLEMICAHAPNNFWCWGREGLLISATQFIASKPPAALDVSGGHFCTISGDTGEARCRGDNEYGQLGNGTTVGTTGLVPVSGAEPMVSISTGDYHTCGQGVSGAIWCWGRNASGQLGDGTTTQSSIPVKVQSGSFGGCQFPDGAAGEMIYNSNQHVLQWCADNQWVALPRPAGAGGGGEACSTPEGSPGAVFFNASHDTLQWCDGTQWIGFPKPPAPCIVGETVIPHGADATFYSASQAPHCPDIAQTRTCQAGSFDGDPAYAHANCATEPGPADCPNVGDQCSDGSVYAGRTPDGWANMFVTSASESSQQWGLSGYQEGMHPNLALNGNRPNWEGRTVTRFLAAYGSSAPAANYCNNLNVHGRSDWYLPAPEELRLLWNNGSPIAGMSSSLVYWAGAGTNSTNARVVYFDTGAVMSGTKTSSNRVRCVRSDAPPLPAVSCDDYFSPPGTVCADGTIFAGHLGSARLNINTSYSSMSYGPISGTTGATFTSDGRLNTEILGTHAGAYNAGKHCYNLTDHGHDDWYLPASGEFTPICLAKDGIGGLGTGYYWSSTESNAVQSIRYRMSNCSSDTATASTSNGVLCMRRVTN